MCSCIEFVFDSLPDYTGLTHHDFSVCHWKAYIHYGMLCVTEDDKQITSIWNSLESAMHNDVKGPSVSSNCVNLTPRPYPVPTRFNIKITKVEAYTYIVVESDFLEITPFYKTTSVFNGTKQHLEENLKLFTVECEVKQRVDSTSSNVYDFLIQPFKELAATLDDQSNGTYLAQVKTMMQHFTQETIARVADTYNKGDTPQGTLLPFCVLKDNKRKVSHSTR